MAGLGRKVFTRERATVADVQGYLMDQTIMVFASASSANAVITSPSEGMTRYLKDVDRIELYDGTRWLPVPRTVGGIQSATTSGAGDVVITHGMGVTPKWAHVTMAGAGTTAAQYGKPAITVSSTTIAVRVHDTRTGAALAGFAVELSWSAGY